MIASNCSGISGANTRTDGGCSLRCLVYASAMLFAMNGGRPHASSNATQPSE